jgi:hypothetical protein
MTKRYSKVRNSQKHDLTIHIFLLFVTSNINEGGPLYDTKSTCCLDAYIDISGRDEVAVLMSPSSRS